MLHLISQLIKMSWFYKNWRWWHQIARSVWNSPKAWKYSVHHHIKVKRRKSYQNKWLTVFLESQFRGLTNYFLINFLSIDKSFWLQSGVNSSALMIKVIRFCSGFKLSGYFLPQAHFLVLTHNDGSLSLRWGVKFSLVILCMIIHFSCPCLLIM